jgi:SET domain-containing protein
MVIDATTGGNSARWINHSCAPNCEAVDDGDRIFIETLRAIRPGEELSYNYGIELEEKHTPAMKRLYQCRCGARRCKGTILQPKSKSKKKK